MKKTNAELAREAERLAAELSEASANLPDGGGTTQGSAHRKLPEALRSRFIQLRAELFERGMYDPVLVRFDTATAPQASTKAIAERLEAVASSLA